MTLNLIACYRPSWRTAGMHRHASLNIVYGWFGPRAFSHEAAMLKSIICHYRVFVAGAAG